MDSDRLAECIGYFKARKVYDRLFGKMRDKYAGLGRLGGTFRLEGLDAEDVRQLGGFFQKDFTGKKSVTISYVAMEKALANSRFEGLDWETVLREYFGEDLIAKKERESEEKDRQHRYFEEILADFPENPGADWLGNVLQTKGEGYLFLTRQQKEAPEKTAKMLRQFLKAAPELPLFRDHAEKRELLPVFAAANTGDPHFFDGGTFGGQLLTAFLKTVVPAFAGRKDDRTGWKAELYYRAGLLKDDLSNHTLAYGIHAQTRDGKLHEGIEGFLRRQEPVLLTLMTLGTLKQVNTQKQKAVYIVENPAVFSVLTSTWPEEAVVCGNGQIRLSTLVLLDLFDEDTCFYYAGDFDPEGLMIAQRLKDRYGDRLRCWNYRRELYERYRSNVEISRERLKKLDRIHARELREIRDAIKAEKRAAYQETMLAEYLRSRPDAAE